MAQREIHRCLQVTQFAAAIIALAFEGIGQHLFLFEQGSNTVSQLDLAPGAGSAPRPVLQSAPVAPNPFKPATRVRYALDRPGAIALAVYDADGRLVLQEEDAIEVVFTLPHGAMPASGWPVHSSAAASAAPAASSRWNRSTSTASAGRFSR